MIQLAYVMEVQVRSDRVGNVVIGNQWTHTEAPRAGGNRLISGDGLAATQWGAGSWKVRVHPCWGVGELGYVGW